MSWIITNTQTGEAVAEIFSAALVAKINRRKYTAQPAGAYLADLNRRIKSGEMQNPNCRA